MKVLGPGYSHKHLTKTMMTSGKCFKPEYGDTCIVIPTDTKPVKIPLAVAVAFYSHSGCTDRERALETVLGRFSFSNIVYICKILFNGHSPVDIHRTCGSRTCINPAHIFFRENAACLQLRSRRLIVAVLLMSLHNRKYHCGMQDIKYPGFLWTTPKMELYIDEAQRMMNDLYPEPVKSAGPTQPHMKTTEDSLLRARIRPAQRTVSVRPDERLEDIPEEDEGTEDETFCVVPLPPKKRYRYYTSM